MRYSKKIIKCTEKSSLLKSIIILFIGIVISSCYNKRLGIRNTNTWIGAYTDEVYKYPNPTIYTNDSIYILSDNIKARKIEDDDDKLVSINDTLSKSLKLWNSDTINLFYLKARETNFDFNLNDLTKNNWETRVKEENESLEKRKIYSFEKSNNLSIQTNYIYNDKILYSEIERYQFKLVMINKVCILHVYNNENYSYSGQIILKDKKSFTVEFLNHIVPKKVDFISIGKNISLTQNHFKVCMEYQIPQYFNDNGTKFKGGLKQIKNIFRENYKYVTTEKKQSGYIRIRFIVNCEGKMGRFSIMELDENYLPFSFDPKIVNSLFKITTRKLQEDWIPGKVSMNDSIPIDNYKHLTFKIKEGKIIDILP